MSHGSGMERVYIRRVRTERVRTKRVRHAAAATVAAVLAVALAACGPVDAQDGTPVERPAAAATATAPAGLMGKTETNGFFRPMRYTAVDGDTWEGIAGHFRMTPEILKSFNESVSVTAGQVIDLRGVDVPQVGAGGSVTGQDEQGRLLYLTRAGDTPAGIASRYGVPLHALRMANLPLLTGGEWIPPAGTTVTIPHPPID